MEKTLEQRHVDARDLTPTYRYKVEEMSETHKKTWGWLEDLVREGRTGEIPPVVAVRDPDDGKLLVYNGNTRTQHAELHGYSLRTIILKDQEDLEAHWGGNRPDIWYNLNEFSELVSLMCIYVKSEGLVQNISEQEKERVKNAHWNVLLQEQRELFPYDDD